MIGRGRRRLGALVAATASVLALLAAPGTAAPQAPDRFEAAPGRWVMGYYPLYERALMPVGEIDWSAMTHLVVGRVSPLPDGGLDEDYDWDADRAPAYAKRLADAATAHGVTPLLMIGGAGDHDAFLAAARDHRGDLVAHLVTAMRDGGFAGLDLDWEPVVDGDQEPLLALARDLREALPDAVLTMPVGWVASTSPLEFPDLYAQLAGVLDRLDVMSYGMAGAWPGWRSWHSSALRGASASTPSSIEANVAAYRDAGVPAAQLGIGIGFYGSCWRGVTGPRQRLDGAALVADDGAMAYTTIVRSYYSRRAYRYDPEAQAPYLRLPGGHGPRRCTYVSYEDPRSVAAKGDYATAAGLGAEIVWSIPQGHVRGAAAGRTDPLLRAVRRHFR